MLNHDLLQRSTAKISKISRRLCFWTLAGHLQPTVWREGFLNLEGASRDGWSFDALGTWSILLILPRVKRVSQGHDNFQLGRSVQEYTDRVCRDGTVWKNR